VVFWHVECLDLLSQASKKLATSTFEMLMSRKARLPMVEPEIETSPLP